MLTKRRPVKARVRTSRKTPGSIDFPQLRREVMLLSNIGLIIRQSRYYRETAKSLQLQENG